LRLLISALDKDRKGLTSGTEGNKSRREGENEAINVWYCWRKVMRLCLNRGANRAPG